VNKTNTTKDMKGVVLRRNTKYGESKLRTWDGRRLIKYTVVDNVSTQNLGSTKELVNKV
jgi:hypothetical protein